MLIKSDKVYTMKNVESVTDNNATLFGHYNSATAW